MIEFRSWWPKWPKPSPTSLNCHQHNSSPASVTSMCNQHHCSRNFRFLEDLNFSQTHWRMLRLLFWQNNELLIAVERIFYFCELDCHGISGFLNPESGDFIIIGWNDRLFLQKSNFRLSVRLSVRGNRVVFSVQAGLNRLKPVFCTILIHHRSCTWLCFVFVWSKKWSGMVQCVQNWSKSTHRNRLFEVELRSV